MVSGTAMLTASQNQAGFWWFADYVLYSFTFSTGDRETRRQSPPNFTCGPISMINPNKIIEIINNTFVLLTNSTKHNHQH